MVIKKNIEPIRYIDNLMALMPNALFIAEPFFCGEHDADAKVKIVKVNKAFCELLGCTDNEILEKPVGEIFEEKELFKILVTRLVNEEHVKSFELAYLRKDGSQVPVLLSASVVKHSSGRAKGIICLAQDITKLKKADDDLKKISLSLENAQRIGRMGNWDWDLVTNEILWSDEIYRIFGYEPKSVKPSFELFSNAVHPADRDYVNESIRKAAEEREPYSIDHRIILPDGLEKIVHEDGEVTYDSNGKAVKMTGAVQDITERKNAEDQLALASKVFESAAEGVMVSDSYGTILSVNPAFTKITGFTAEEALGKNPNILRSDRHDQAFYDNMWKKLITEGAWQGEIWNRRKSGKAYPEWLNITAIKNQQGKTERYVAVFHDLTDIIESREKVEYQANHDALTGLPNRVLFMDRLKVGIRLAQRIEKKLAVLSIGIDRFSSINESFGHIMGDGVLQAVGDKLKEYVHESDTVSRYSGDEFTILLEDIDSIDDAVKHANEILEGMEKPFTVNGKELFITVSVGVTIYPDDGNKEDALISNAVTAMARAKEEGRNKYSLFIQAMNERAMVKLAMESNLRRALEKGEIKVYYQPKVDLTSGKIVGAEALVRWIREDGSSISPGLFVPVAEETGLIFEIGELVMRTACKDNKEWIDAGFHQPIIVSVNLSARQFQGQDIVKFVESALSDTGLPYEYIELEITESVIVVDVEKAIDMMLKLSSMGIKLSIDDFGTGYSSLSYLKRFPINTLKVDQVFVRDLPGDADNAAITIAIISLAKNLGLKVIAEGVENREALEFLKKNGCDEMQGFYFSKPLPKDEFEKLLKDGKTIIN